MLKRLFDFAVIGVCAPLWLPLMVALATGSLLIHGRPVLFKQKRGGWRGSEFWLYKFRTMTNAMDKAGNLLPDDQRLTRFGRFLRSTSLDELPAIFNVIRGEMSLVGPRPFVADYLPLYTRDQARRHDVRPGITGWAQVNGRNEISWEEKFRLDLWYVDHQSFWLDIKILLLTAGKVLGRHGISQQGHATAEPFRGSRRQQ